MLDTDMEITLAPSEVLQGALGGAMRYVQNLRKQRRDKHGAEHESGWDTHINGALGEVAVAKWLGRYWDGMGALGDLHAGDVRGVQVRWRSKAWYDLILHVDDEDDLPFVLVTGDAPKFRLHGWLLGHEGKRPCFWADPAGGRPAFFVPKADLRPMAALLAHLEMAPAF